jgi:hypothetical protein
MVGQNSSVDCDSLLLEMWIFGFGRMASSATKLTEKIRGK